MSTTDDSSFVMTGDCVEKMQLIPASSIALTIADPPYNIGFNYGDGEYKDNLPADEYQQWTRQWLAEVYRILTPYGTFWTVIGDESVAELKVAACQLGFKLRSWVIWYYTFGVNSPNKFSRSHAHLLYFVKNEKYFTFHADQIRVPSARAVEYNDKRANPDGRLPDDTWILRPKELPDGFAAESDTWTIPRICGTFKQRVQGAANQLPEQLVGRIIRACSNPEDVVLDPMCGTGTVLAVAKKLGRQYIGYELSETFSQIADARVRAAKVGDDLDGPIPPGG